MRGPDQVPALARRMVDQMPQQRLERGLDVGEGRRAGLRGLSRAALLSALLRDRHLVMRQIHVARQQGAQFARPLPEVDGDGDKLPPSKGYGGAAHQLQELARVEEGAGLLVAPVGPLDVGGRVVGAHPQFAGLRAAGVAEHGGHVAPDVAGRAGGEGAAPDAGVERVAHGLEIVGGDAAHRLAPEQGRDVLLEARAVVGDRADPPGRAMVEPAIGPAREGLALEGGSFGGRGDKLAAGRQRGPDGALLFGEGLAAPLGETQARASGLPGDREQHRVGPAPAPLDGAFVLGAHQRAPAASRKMAPGSRSISASPSRSARRAIESVFMGIVAASAWRRALSRTASLSRDPVRQDKLG